MKKCSFCNKENDENSNQCKYCNQLFTNNSQNIKKKIIEKDIVGSLYSLSFDRATRKHFFLVFVLSIIGFIVVGSIVQSSSPGSAMHQISSATFAGVAIVFLKLSISRWNDLNLPGIFVLTQFLIIPNFFLLILRGTIGTNKYGSDPLFEKNTNVARKGICPNCKNILIKTNYNGIDFVFCLNKHGYLDKKNNWVPLLHGRYIKNMYGEYINNDFTNMPYHLQGILFLENYTNNQTNIKEVDIDEMKNKNIKIKKSKIIKKKQSKKKIDNNLIITNSQDEWS